MESRSRLSRAQAVALSLRSTLVGTWSDLASEHGAAAVRTSQRLALVEPVLPGIYAEYGRSGEFVVRATALTRWAAPIGLVSGLAAAYLCGIVDDHPDRITVQVPQAWHLKGPRWVRPLRIAPMGQRPYRSGGIRLVSPPDAVVQSWREARPDIGAATVIAAVDRKVTTASDLADALARRKQMPRRGELSQLLHVVGTHVTSYLEYVAWRDVFPPDMFPWLGWQVEMWPNGRQRFYDAWDAEAGIDLEFDGGSTHGGIEGFERDRQRDVDVRAAGHEPLHFTYRDLTQRPEWCRQVYIELRRARLASGARPLGS